MTEAETLLDLARRCEEATGPDREFDAAIWDAIFGGEMYWSTIQRGDEWCLRYYPGPPCPEYHFLKRFTDSLDAAVTLVPEGMAWRVDTLMGMIGAIVCEPDACRSMKTAPCLVLGKTPALALCAAALRARAKESSNG